MNRGTIVSSLFAAAVGCMALVAGPSTALGIVAYEVPAGVDGNQDYGGNLGMSFDVNQPIIIRELGVFDDDSNGLTSNLNAQIWNRATATSLAQLNFTPGSQGTLAGGSRFKALSTPLILPAGFQGMITAGGFNSSDENGNQGSVNLGATTNSGGGLITFVNGNRFNLSAVDPVGFPTGVDGTPVNRYLAGTFSFELANIAYQVSAGATGTQNFGGSVGMDFQVNQSTDFSHLGVFDSGSDGFVGTLTAQLWVRNENGTPGAFGDDTGTLVAQTTFTGTQGELLGGSRFKELTDADFLNGFNGILGPGTNASIVVFGFSAADPLGNVGAFTGTKTTFDGFGALTFEGSSRFGTAGLFPNTPDGGPANRYAAGTFRFNTIPEPASATLLLAGVLGLVGRRRRTA